METILKLISEALQENLETVVMKREINSITGERDEYKNRNEKAIKVLKGEQ